MNALDEITTTVRKTAEGATHARSIVSTAKGDAEQSSAVVGRAVEAMSGIESSSKQIGQIISVIDEIAELPGIKGVPGAWEMVVYAGQVAYAHAYKYVYLVSIAFGAVSIVAALFLGDISKYMDDHIAVVM